MVENQVQEVKDRVDIVAVVGTYLSLEKKGRHYKGLCPFHQEKTPSFVVSPEMQIYKCFGCGKGGDVFNFLEEVEGMSFSQALEVLAEQAGVKLVRRTQTDQEKQNERFIKMNEMAAELFSYLLKDHAIGQDTRDYLSRRGINLETINDFRLGYSPQRWDFLGKYLMSKGFLVNEIISAGLALPKTGDRGFYDRFRGRLMLPLIDPRGKVIGFSARALKADDDPKYLNSPETPIFSKSNFLFGGYQARSAIIKEKSAVLVEGVLDVCSLHQAGVKNAVASQGTALTTSQLNLLSKQTDTLIFCFDGDGAGMEATKKGGAMAQERNFDVKILLLPPGKDPDDVVREGEFNFKELLKQVVPLMDFYFQKSLIKNDPTNPQGKKRISEELLPAIYSLSNAVERSHYLKKLAEILDVREDVLILPTNVKDVVETPALRSETFSEGLGIETRSVLEEYILSLLLKASVEKAKKAAHRVGKMDFDGEQNRELFTLLKEELEGRSYKINIQKFSAKLSADLQDLLSRCYLSDLGRIEADLDLLEKELERSLQLLKNRSIKRELKQLSQRIKAAEVSGEETASEQLQQQFQDLTQRLQRVSG